MSSVSCKKETRNQNAPLLLQYACLDWSHREVHFPFKVKLRKRTEQKQSSIQKVDYIISSILYISKRAV